MALKQIDMTREEELNKVLRSVVNNHPMFWDNPNGGYEYSCHYCGTKVIRGENDEPEMKDLTHDPECVWLIAKDLLTD